MLEFLKRETNITNTQNGAVTYKSTLSNCLDFFYRVGALRNSNTHDIISLFDKAYIENPEFAMKILFYARDIRGGLGERRLFRICIKYLAKVYPNSLIKNLTLISEFGRFDDLLCLINMPNCKLAVMELIRNQLDCDIKAMYTNGENISLLAKWLPSINTSSKETVKQAKQIANYLKMSDAQYRKTLSKLRKYIDIIENRLRERDYTFDYAKQPSKAMFKYKKAFIRNDEKRYSKFLESVDKGEAELKTSSLYPYDIVREILCKNYESISKSEVRSLNTTWNSLVKSSPADTGNALAIVDGSGSMYNYYNRQNGEIRPIDVSISLGIYFAEHNKGTFANHFITFSSRPQLIEIKGRNIVEKVQYVKKYNEVANTNIEAVFSLLLNTATKYKLKQSDLPETLYIISDMEFDYAVKNAGSTNFENAKKIFKRYGYDLPNVIFWNVNSMTQQVPVTMNENGVALVSGATPKLFDMVKSGETSPIKLMLDIINSERYKDICA